MANVSSPAWTLRRLIMSIVLCSETIFMDDLYHG